MLFIAFFFASASAFASSEVTTNCKGQASLSKIELKLKLVLNQKFQEAAPFGSELKEAMALQLKYANSHLQNEINSETETFLITGEEKDYHVDSITPSHYPHDLKLDYPEAMVDEIPGEGYFKRAMRRGSTSIQDPAWIVRYTVRFDLLRCSRSKAKRPLPSFMIPQDPYLAYWLIEGQERRPLRFNQASVQANPCAGREYPDVSDPAYYWYFWSPTRKGADEESKPFECATLLREERGHYQVVAPTETENAPLRNIASAKAESFVGTGNQIGLIFGFTNYQARLQSPVEMEKLIRTVVRDGGQAHVSEHGTDELLRFIAYLKKSHSLKWLGGKAKSQHLLFRLSIRPRNHPSQPPAIIEAYIGPTDHLGPLPAEHEETAKRFLASKDFVLYSGHAGLGRNFDLSKLVSGKIRASRIAILSCISKAYYSDAQGAAIQAKLTHRTELFLTGSSGSNHFKLGADLILGRQSRLRTHPLFYAQTLLPLQHAD